MTIDHMVIAGTIVLRLIQTVPEAAVLPDELILGDDDMIDQLFFGRSAGDNVGAILPDPLEVPGVRCD